MDRIKFLLKIILYTVIIFFTSIFITTLYIVSNQGVDSFQRGLSAFFLTMLCAFLLLLLCNQFKKGLIFSLEKFKFLEDFIKNNTLKRILKILLRLVLYSLIIFLNTLFILKLRYNKFLHKSQKSFVASSQRILHFYTCSQIIYHISAKS